MCGLSGILNFSSRDKLTLDSLARMMGTISYRGPDETGFYLDDQIGLGHVRLSIIDLAGGSQPIANEDERFWIVYNGEVFNYPELRQGLVERGHRFSTNTDTEVILHLFEELGEGCLDELNGQFVFAIWDRVKRELFIGRDRFGIRPLFFCRDRGNFIFSSEIKSILAVSDMPRALNPRALEQVFTFWTTLPGVSVFAGISELKPGHYLRVTQEGIQERAYWSPPYYEPEEQLTASPDEISEEILELLADAVRIRLRADVAVGTYLSGGLDSSGITALVARRFNHEVQTFGLGFEEADFDERSFQQEMVARLKVRHCEVLADNAAIAAHFPKVVWHAEKPLLRTAPVPLFLLSRQVRDQGFKVVLTGEGADEVFGGYNIFKEALVRRFWARQPDSEARPGLITQLYPNIFRNPKMRTTMLRFFGQGLDRCDDPLFSHLIRWENTRRIRSFFSPDLVAAIGDYDCLDELRASLPPGFHQRDTLAKAQYLEQNIFLSNYLLSSQGDRVAMANSIEIRLPFLDYRLAQYMARVPSIWKILGLDEKHILKKSLAGIVPDSVRRRPKHPYRAPIQESLYHPRARESFAGFLSERSLQESGLFQPARVAMFMKKLEAGRSVSEVDGMALAGILSSQILYQQFIREFPAPEQTRAPDLVFDRRSSERK